MARGVNSFLDVFAYFYAVCFNFAQKGKPCFVHSSKIDSSMHIFGRLNCL